MPSYREDFRAAERKAYWTFPRVAVGIVIGSLMLGTAGFVINLASQPARIVSKTLDADNVIMNYEKFHDVNANFLARKDQVKQFKQLLGQETDAGEKNRLRIEMAAMQSSCRDLARKYNADSAKINRGLFRGNSLPENLNSGECE